MVNIANILSEKGPFAKAIQGFSPRRAQQEMAQAVFVALQENTILIAEAGTGTGKTFAYLVPAVLSGKRIIISTGTKTLQDQLFHQDLPLVRRVLARPITVELLKGRSNYLCRYHLYHQAALYQYPALTHRIKTWAERSRTGDLAELEQLPEDHPIRPYLTSTPDNCLGQACEFFEHCFVMQARRRAQVADLVVINHHLLCADIALKDAGFGELLPETQGLIIDEAHQLEEVASNFFGTTLSAHQLLDFCRDVVLAQVEEAGDMGDLGHLADVLEKTVKDMRLALGENNARLEWQVVKQDPLKQAAFDAMLAALVALEAVLQIAAPRGKVLDNCWQRAKTLCHDLDLFAKMQEKWIYWLEIHARSFTLHLTPLQVAETFRQQMQRHSCAWVFASATLTVDQDFSHFQNSLGLTTAVTCRRWDSPFNFSTQALLYLPKSLPEPNQAHYIQELMALALMVLAASRGRAFILFTSHRSLQEAAGYLRDSAVMAHYPLLVQGSMPKSQLLEQFKRLGNAVLLGTSSFWEGVDVRGPALSCVIIEKLPFAAPTDPVLKARIKAIKEAGGDPFMEYQLPQAVIALKQGVGRLIRAVDDVGLLMLCDPRLLNRRYGKVFLDSLPEMPQVHDIAAVQQFFVDNQ